jgi:dihydroxyacid dehydratase/phosphogluconate dehydratase
MTAGQSIIMPVAEPIKATGHLQCLYGNIAPEGSVAKITGKEGLYFKGFAKVYDSEEVGPGELCSPRHHPHSRPSSLEINCSL